MKRRDYNRAEEHYSYIASLEAGINPTGTALCSDSAAGGSSTSLPNVYSHQSKTFADDCCNFFASARGKNVETFSRVLMRQYVFPKKPTAKADQKSFLGLSALEEQSKMFSLVTGDAASRSDNWSQLDRSLSPSVENFFHNLSSNYPVVPLRAILDGEDVEEVAEERKIASNVSVASSIHGPLSSSQSSTSREISIAPSSTTQAPQIKETLKKCISKPFCRMRHNCVESLIDSILQEISKPPKGPTKMYALNGRVVRNNAPKNKIAISKKASGTRTLDSKKMVKTTKNASKLTKKKSLVAKKSKSLRNGPEPDRAETKRKRLS